MPAHYKLPFREAAVRLYQYFGNMRKTADALNIGVATVWRWVKISIHPKVRKAMPKRKLSEAIIDYLRSYLPDNGSLTQCEIAHELSRVFSLPFSRQCIACALKQLGYSRKRISHRGIPKDQERYQTLLESFKTNYDPNVVAIDEVGFDFRTTPHYGYAPRGQKCIINSLSFQRKRMSVIMAIDRKGHYFYKAYYRTVKGQDFRDFITQLPMGVSSKILMDNASIHKTDDVRNAVASKGSTIIYTVPYTPECNPIENVFSVIKSYFRKYLVKDPTMDYEVIFTRILKTLDTSHLFEACYRNTEAFLSSKKLI